MKTNRTMQYIELNLSTVLCEFKNQVVDYQYTGKRKWLKLFLWLVFYISKHSGYFYKNYPTPSQKIPFYKLNSQKYFTGI